MKNARKKLLFATILLQTSTISYAQTNGIEVEFIGNAALYLTDGELDIYVDFPYKSGAYGYMTYAPTRLDSLKENAIFIFTHRHADHYSKKLLKEVDGRIMGPWKVPKKKRVDLEDLERTAPDFSIQAFKTEHRFALKHNSYLITWHGKRIFISGDTESAETIAEVKDLDWAIVPYWLVVDANEKQIEIDADKRMIYHLYPDQKITGEIPEDIIMLNEQDKVFSLPY